jgi:chromosome segregation protein
MQVQADLDAQLRLWYGYRWSRGLAELEAAHAQERDAHRLADARQELLRRLDERAAGLSQRYSTLRNQLGDWHRENSLLHRRAEATQRELAVGDERLRQLEARRLDLLAELGPLQERLHSQQQQVQAAQAERSAQQGNLAGLQSAIAAVQERLNAVESERRSRQGHLATAQRRQAQLEQELTAQERKLLEQESRKATLDEERQRLDAELIAAQGSQAELTPQLHELQARLAEIEQEGSALAARRQDLQQAIAQSEAELARRDQQLASARRSADRLHDQLDLLQRLKDEGEGYSGGARSVMRSLGDSRGTPLAGIIGAVADQLQTPAELELAIETALGGRLQRHHRRTVERRGAGHRLLKRTNGGRATFLPLDTLRTGQPMRPPSGPGVVGLASQLVKAEPRLAKLVDYLLGRVVITQDLPTARRVLDSYPERPTVVTLTGDIVRPGGSVSGGSVAPRRDQGVLGRERALRELPEQLQQAADAAAIQEQARAAALEALQQSRQTLAGLDQELAALARRRQSESAALAQLQGQTSQLGQQLRRSQQRLAAASDEQSSLASRAEQARQRLAELATQIERASQESAAAVASLAEMDAGRADRRADAAPRGRGRGGGARRQPASYAAQPATGPGAVAG